MNDPKGELLVIDPKHDGKAKNHTATIGIACAIVLVLVSLVFIIGGVRELGPELEAARGEGTHGTLDIYARSCSKDGCTWAGEFVSTDGRLRLADVETDDLKHKALVGENVTVIYVEGRAYAEDSTKWKNTVLSIGAFSIIGIIVIGGTAWLWRSSRRAK